jgi:ABC-type proline/glycine betaine transport system substrate-binding protein
MEEQMILKSLTDKAEKFRASQTADMLGTNPGTGAKLHQQYQKIIESLSFN